MTGRSARPWFLALGVSLLLHVGVFGSLRWMPPQGPSFIPTLPIEARLVAGPKPVAEPAPSPAVRQAPVPSKPAAPEFSEPPDDPASMDATPLPPSEADEGSAVATHIEAAPVVAPVVSEKVFPPLNALPARLDLRFQVSYGLASGEQTLKWVNEGERYTLISVAEATGLAGMFYRGHFVQTSHGRVTPQGLRPEAFWDQRGDKRSSARFDAGQLTYLPAKGASRHFSYQGEVQDVLSLFFQMALTAPPADGLLSYRVFNGKKLREYTYEVRGEMQLETALGPLRTLHLVRRVADGDGRFEIWLAIDRFYLPVRVLRSDENGSEVELKLQSITP